MDIMERILTLPSAATDIDVGWLPRPNKAELVLTRVQPPIAFVPTAFVMAFCEDGRAAFANNLLRGLELAGGHIDPGETAEMAAARESVEETGCVVDGLVQIGFLRSVSAGVPPAGYTDRYPFPLSFQQFFLGTIVKVGIRTMPEECGEPSFLDTQGVATANFRSRNIRALHAEAMRVRAEMRASTDLGISGGLLHSRRTGGNC